MGWTAPATRSTGNLITATIWNDQVVNNLLFLKRGTRYLWTGTATNTSTSTTFANFDANTTQTIAADGGRLMVGINAYGSSGGTHDINVLMEIAGGSLNRVLTYRGSLSSNLSAVFLDNSARTGNVSVNLQFRTSSAGNSVSLTVLNFWIVEMPN